MDMKNRLHTVEEVSPALSDSRTAVRHHPTPISDCTPVLQIAFEG